jgi:predicted aldo/keto reductase-like oxidoreductase
MKYRRFGKLDWEASALGFGCMRLPTLGGDHAQIDEAEATRIVRYAIDHGVNYFDSAYGYHSGNSERFLGRALKGGYREKVRVATKMPTGEVKEYADFDRLLNEQLSKLDLPYIDFYLLHGLRKERWDAVYNLGYISWAEKALADGRVRHLGFSFHDSYDALKAIIDAFDGWTMCQIQYNYMNEEVQAGTKGLEYAASKGLAVVVMEPLLGGRLVNPPAEVEAIWQSDGRGRSPAEWGFDWLWNKPQVTVALSGMSTMQQVQENIASANRSGTNILSEADLALVARVRDQYQQLCPIPCTDCKYCMPCPNGVNIPHNFSMFNGGAMYNKWEDARKGYTGRFPEPERASACIQCRECEDKCPQKIEISQWMPYVHQVLGEGKPHDETLCPQTRASA